MKRHKIDNSRKTSYLDSLGEHFIKFNAIPKDLHHHSTQFLWCYDETQ